jgi:hypothetical protein
MYHIYSFYAFLIKENKREIYLKVYFVLLMLTLIRMAKDEYDLIVFEG